MNPVVLAISGSLRKPSFTEKMLDLCIEGMGPDLEVQTFYPHKMNIGPCNSCYACWSQKTPGRCAQQEDFEKILDVYKRADYFLLAAPLYVFDFPATVKNVLDRFIVTLEPTQVKSPTGRSAHPSRFDRHPKAVLISSCGFPELENFEILRPHFKTICEHMAWNFAGEILIPAAGAANAPRLFDKKYGQIKQAGRELIQDHITPETTQAIAAPVMPNDDDRQLATLAFEGGVIAKAKMTAITLKAIKNMKQDQ